MSKHRYESRIVDEAAFNKGLKYLEEAMKHLRLVKKAHAEGDLQAELKHTREALKYAQRAEALGPRAESLGHKHNL